MVASEPSLSPKLRASDFSLNPNLRASPLSLNPDLRASALELNPNFKASAPMGQATEPGIALNHPEVQDAMVYFGLRARIRPLGRGKPAINH